MSISMQSAGKEQISIKFGHSSHAMIVLGCLDFLFDRLRHLAHENCEIAFEDIAVKSVNRRDNPILPIEGLEGVPADRNFGGEVVIDLRYRPSVNIVGTPNSVHFALNADGESAA